jgi:hypothetical protein
MESGFQNYVSQRLLRGVGDRERNIFCADLGGNAGSFAVKLNSRTLPFRAHHFDVAPADAVTPSCTESLHASFLRGETSGITFETIGSSLTIIDLAFGEYTVKKAVAKAFDAFADARNFGNVDSCADDHTNIVNWEFAIGNWAQKRLSPR